MPRNVWLLIIGMLVNVIGNSFLWPLNTIYMHDHLGKSLSIAGLVLMANSAAGIVGNLVGGYLFDKVGGYRSIMLGIVLSIISLAGLTLWHTWTPYILFLTLLGFGGGIVFPSMFAMVGTAWPDGGRRGFNAIYMAQNLGVAVGPAFAGFVANASFDYLFAVNLGMYVLFFFIALFSYRVIGKKIDTPKHQVSESKLTVNRAPFYSLLIVSSGFILCWLGYSQWSTTFSAYTQSIGISLKEYSFLWTINGLLIIVAQPIVNPIVKRWENHLKRQLVLGISIMLLSFFVVGFAGDFKMFAAAMVILTIGEMFVWPAVPTIAHQLAPASKQGLYQGIVNSAATIGRMFGPFIGGVVVDQYGMIPLVWILCLLFAIAIVPFLLYDICMREEALKKPVLD